MSFKPIKRFVPYVIRFALALPVSVILTLMLSPFWDWFERISGIESLGFHGPAPWCHIFMFFAVALILITRFWIKKES
jgi:H+/Cl- antiporter ClcA